MAATFKKTCRIVGVRTIIFLIYLFIGAGVFLGIEKSKAAEKKALAKIKYNAFVLQFIKDFNISEDYHWNISFRLLQAYQEKIFEDVDRLPWSFVNAFLFSGNVVTTIGKCIIV